MRLCCTPFPARALAACVCAVVGKYMCGGVLTWGRFSYHPPAHTYIYTSLDFSISPWLCACACARACVCGCDPQRHLLVRRLAPHRLPRLEFVVLALQKVKSTQVVRHLNAELPSGRGKVDRQITRCAQPATFMDLYVFGARKRACAGEYVYVCMGNTRVCS